MRSLISIFLIIVLFASCDQFLASSSESTSSSKRSKKNGKVVQKYPNGNIKTEITYKDGKKHGVAKQYYENGQVKLSITYKNGYKEGPSAYYYKNGKLYHETEYKNDKKDGIQKKYSGGKLIAEIPFKDGREMVGLKEYYLSGKEKSFPTINISAKDTRSINNKYTLYLSFSDPNPKDEFYVGSLEEEKYIHYGLNSVVTKDGTGIIEMSVPFGAFLMQELNFVGVHYTNIGNKYITERSYNLVIE